MTAGRIPSVEGGIQPTLLTTTGDILYASSASNPARLAIGSSAQVLTVASGVPSWATPAAGGKVLQVVNATYSTAVSSSSTTYVDTGLTATITPTSATSKILVLVSQQILKDSNSANSGLNIRLFRGATKILEHEDLLYTGTAIFNIGMYTINYYDSPATTSATTYKTQFANRVAAVDVIINVANDISSITLMEIGA